LQSALNPHVADGEPAVSVVVPVKNETDNVVPLLEEIHAALAGRDEFEAIFIDDCSSDDTVEKLVAARDRFPMVRVVKHELNCGQSAAIRTGVLSARAPIVCTLDGDGQNDPADLPQVIDKLRQGNSAGTLSMVMGQRMKRQDSFTKKISSKLANSVRSNLLSDGTRDTGCGLKAFYRDGFLRLPYFDHMHRYVPALMRREGYAVDFVDVRHRPRVHGSSKYGVIDRLLVSIRDVLGVMWLNRRLRRPGNRTEV
jgi:dolichol-phosphate mannosyltransferase